MTHKNYSSNQDRDETETSTTRYKCGENHLSNVFSNRNTSFISEVENQRQWRQLLCNLVKCVATLRWFGPCNWLNSKWETDLLLNGRLLFYILFRFPKVHWIGWIYARKCFSVWWFVTLEVISNTNNCSCVLTTYPRKSGTMELRKGLDFDN